MNFEYVYMIFLYIYPKPIILELMILNMFQGLSSSGLWQSISMLASFMIAVGFILRGIMITLNMLKNPQEGAGTKAIISLVMGLVVVSILWVLVIL